MKKKTIKSVKAIAISFCLGLFAFGGMIWEETPEILSVNATGDALTMDAGASLRVSEDETDTKTGLIYTIRMDKEVYEQSYEDKGYTFGILIAPNSMHEATPLNAASVFGIGQDAIKVYDWATFDYDQNQWVYDSPSPYTRIVNISDTKLYVDPEDEDSYIFEASMTNIHDYNLAKEFYGVGYVLSGDGTVVSFTQANGNVISPAYIAQKAIADTTNDLTDKQKKWLAKNYLTETVTNTATTYSVNHYVEQIDGSFVLDSADSDMPANVNSVLTAADLKKSIENKVFIAEKTADEITVLANGRTQINLYYGLDSVLLRADKEAYSYTNSNKFTATIATKDDLAAISGDYKGEAVKINAQTYTNSLNAKIALTQTEYETVINAGYTKLYFWMAFHTSNNADLTLGAKDSDQGLNLFSITSGTYVEQNVWKKWTVNLADIEDILFNDVDDNGIATVKLIKHYIADANRPEDGVVVYLGNCGFDETTKVDYSSLYRVNADTVGSHLNWINLTPTTTSVLSSGEEYNTVVANSGYTGNLVKWTGVTHNKALKFTPELTSEQLATAVAKGYTKLSFYVAVSEDGVLCSRTNSSTNYIANGSTAAYTYQKTLAKITVSLSDTRNSSTIQDLLYNEDARLLNVYKSGATNLTVYLSDIILEK